MASYVPYISSSNSISEKTKVTKSTTSPLNFENRLKGGLPDSKPLTTGGAPVILDGKRVPVDYGIKGPIDKNYTLDDIVSSMNTSLYIQNSTDTVSKTFNKNFKNYNRFKIPMLNGELQKGFPHLFFVRPNCNLLGSNYKLLDSLKRNETFYYTWRHSPEVMRDLVKNSGTKNDFMMTLSNAADSFSVNDEAIDYDSYGKTYTGYKITYGKNNISSKTAGDFTISVKDDRDLHMYQLHRVWVEYINGVYRGEIAPQTSSIINKVLDYAGACYYIITAEDGETILFWTKYYGVFPISIPNTQYSWGSGNTIRGEKLDITYRYSFKQDFNPYNILEFNYNSRVDTEGVEYLPIFDSKLNQTSSTWVGAPFIVLEKDNNGMYQYKLKFRTK